MVTAAELRAAQDRYERALAELREARNALAEAERLIGACRRRPRPAGGEPMTLSAIARMNIAATSDEQLAVLRDFFAIATASGRKRALAYLEAIDEEIERRRQVTS